MHKTLRYLYQKGRLTEIDVYFARFIAGLINDNDPSVMLAAALVSNATGSGHICLDLAASSQTVLLDGQDSTPNLVCPDLGRWEDTLHNSPVVGKPGDRRPIILDANHRLYLYRYWEYEHILVELIQHRASRQISATDIDYGLLKEGLHRFFPEKTGNNINWQKVAGLSSALKQFCVISGGPGTGKTFTIVKILALLIEQAGSGHIKIALAAPTGKAAAKLGETLKMAGHTLQCSQRVIDAIPVEARTIHRLLKPVPNTPYFQYNAENRLPADLVVIDEASMVDLAMMSKLMQALADTARFILVGDKDQLASVEAGAVLGDICNRGNTHRFSSFFGSHMEELTGENVHPLIETKNRQSGIEDCIVSLEKNYRFAETSGIGELSRTINQGDGGQTLTLLKSDSDTSIRWQPVSSLSELNRELGKRIIQGYKNFITADDPAQAIALFNRFRLLCAVKKGPFGVEVINQLAEQVLMREGLIRANDSAGNPWYTGRPVMITKNDYNLGLFNGDTGITRLQTESNGNRRGHLLNVYFPTADDTGELRSIPPYRLSDHETVYAMTVHKSQGSEFENVHLILPDIDAPVLSRELLYTAVTRARKTVTIWGKEEILTSAIGRRIRRTSGLRDALWGGANK